MRGALARRHHGADVRDRGLGPSETNEGFTEPYDLPNESAYAETCAAVALAFWAQRMLHLDLDGAYADVMELALYNGALSGLSREGSHYFYANPLESRGQHKRWAWHLCPCCTMNVSRLVASIAGYAISASGSASPSTSMAASRRRRRLAASRSAQSAKRLSMAWQRRDQRRARDPDRFRSEAAHPRLGARRDGRGQRGAGRARPRAGLRKHPPSLEPGRHCDPQSANAARAPLRPSQGPHGRRPCGA